MCVVCLCIPGPAGFAPEAVEYLGVFLMFENKEFWSVSRLLCFALLFLMRKCGVEGSEMNEQGD